jgi:hypothetical protein
MKMRDLAPMDVRSWCEQLERRGVSPRSIKHAKLALGLMFSCAAEDGAVGGNPVKVVTYIPSPEARAEHPQRQPKKMGRDDVLAVLAAMPELWQTFFLLLLQSGMRIGEMIGLRWKNVHLADDPHIDVVEQVYRGERKPPKWDSIGSFDLSPTMATMLTKLKEEALSEVGGAWATVQCSPLARARLGHMRTCAIESCGPRSAQPGCFQSWASRP